MRRLFGGGARAPGEVLGDVTPAPTCLEDLKPLATCLEWRLADAFWRRSGVIPFSRNDVPYLVNNNGRQSEAAAALVHATLEETRAVLPARIVLLELGAGTGLHARYFLDTFSDLCRERGSDFYNRLTYMVTDRFERTVTAWREVGLFEDHEAHVALAVCDATSPRDLSVIEGSSATIDGAPLVVFCNYLLDVLPSRVARRTDTGLEQLHVRTHLAGGDVALKIAGLASLDEARALAASGREEDLERLLPLLGQLDFETAYHPWTPAPGPEATLAAEITGSGRVIINHGALACLETLFEILHSSGFVLVNDYGPVCAEDVGNHVGAHRFGGSVALAVNFPLLEKVLTARGFTVVAPEEDEGRRIHTRLIGRKVGDRTADVLRKQFRLENDRWRDEPLEEARRHVAAGRSNEAIAAYRTAIERNPRDWQMIGEAAEFAGLQLKDYGAGLEIARAALERNPWCSAWLWNVLGDCLFCNEKLDEAHEAYLQAERIDPDDPRTNLNLAYTYSANGKFDEALSVIARGLAQDARMRSAYRVRLLEKQNHVLSVLSERAAAEQERLVKRTERFR